MATRTEERIVLRPGEMPRTVGGCIKMSCNFMCRQHARDLIVRANGSQLLVDRGNVLDDDGAVVATVEEAESGFTLVASTPWLQRLQAAAA